MIFEIDGLRLPPNTETKPELINADKTVRTPSGRLIVKRSPRETWKVTVKLPVMSLELQTAFYAKCMLMRNSKKTIKFISPYDGTIKTIVAVCTSKAGPNVLNMRQRIPSLYKDSGAIFEEV